MRLERDGPLIHTHLLAHQALLLDWLGQFFDPLKFQATFRGQQCSGILALSWEMEFLSSLSIALDCVDAAKDLILSVIFGQQYLLLGNVIY